MTGANVLIQALEAEGVDVIFGYPGAAICPVYDALIGSSIRHVLVRQEQNAGHAASGYSRTGDRIGVCMTTSGPGATNLITALATAYADSIPLLAITGQVSSELLGRDVFQEVDTTGIVAPFIKHSYLVERAEELPQLIRNAIHIATTGRPGPVLIDIPMDIQLAPAEYIPAVEPNLRGYKPTVRGHAVQVQRAAEAIAAAKKPLLVAGGGVFAAHAVAEFREFVKTTGIPVVHTMMGKGVVPFDDPLQFGMVGTHGASLANVGLSQADLLILVGARAGDRAMASPSALGKTAQIIHIDVDPAEIGKNMSTAIPIVGDARAVLRQLLQKVSPPDITEWIASLQAQRKQKPPFAATGPLDPRALISALSAALDEDALYVSDVGRNQIWSARYHGVRRGKFLTSCGMGTMGYALPAAIGAQTAAPGRQTIAVCGDGAFQMQLPELATLLQERLPVKIVVLRDGQLGMIQKIQNEQFGGRHTATELGMVPDLRLLAAAYGLEYGYVDQNEDICKALEKLTGTEGAYLLEAVVQP